MDDIASLVAQAVAKRVKEAQARQAALARPPAVVAQPAAPAAPAIPRPPAAAPVRAPVARAPADPFGALPDTARPMQTMPLLNAFQSAPSLLGAFVLHEALGKPVALREDKPHF